MTIFIDYGALDKYLTMINKLKLFFATLHYRTIDKIKRKIAFRRRLKELRKRDPFIYK